MGFFIKVFISYSTANTEIAEKVCQHLEKNGKNCWIAPRNIAVGKEYGGEIIRGIENSDVFILIFSEASNNSQHVLREVERAVNSRIPIVAFKIEDCQPTKSMEYFLLTNQWLDATNFSNEILNKLNSSIDALFNDSATAKATSKTASDIKKTSSFSHKTMAISLGVIAVGIIAIVVVLQGIEKSIDSSTVNNNVTTNASRAVDEVSPTIESSANANVWDSIEVGTLINFGQYFPNGFSEENNDGTLSWRIIDLNKADSTLTLLSEKIIDLKPFDGAHSGYFDKSVDGENYDRNAEYTAEQMIDFRGSNSWENSDIRSWLNSDEYPVYDTAPVDFSTDEHGNGFDLQSGFLSDFSAVEKSMLVENNLENGITDKVFLLSVDEINRYKDAVGFPLYTKPTQSAIDSDETSWYNTYVNSGAEDYIWATRTAVENTAHQIYAVNISLVDDFFTPQNAAAAGLGIRPAITISLDNCTVSGDGNDTPFILDITLID